MYILVLSAFYAGGEQMIPLNVFNRSERKLEMLEIM